MLNPLLTTYQIRQYQLARRAHTVARAELNNVRWISHCRDLAQLPVAA